MDVEGNIIPIVEDDMGEGFKDPIEDIEAQHDQIARQLVEEEAKNTDIPEDEFENLVEKIPDKALKEFLKDPTHKGKQRKAMVEAFNQPKKPTKYKMQRGMPIDFMGHRYRVLWVKNSRKGERVLLKYVREI